MAIPVTPEYDVSVGKSLKTKKFRMEFNASVVKALTSTLYNHKKEAVVREYSTNITDSHIYAGHPEKKGYIFVPTKMNPLIKFQDKGTGMSEDDIYSIYTVLGKSTKRDENVSSGSLGFGAKSFISVADQMTVSSIKDGEKVVVVCYMDSQGELTGTTKSKTKTKEGNGTCVEIPVKLSEVHEWQECCARVLGSFRNPHSFNSLGDYEDIFHGLQLICKEVREKKSVYKGSTPDYLRNHRSNTLVLMGDILYHLPVFESLVVNTKIKNLVVNSIDQGVYITNYDIGELDHAPSREAISYDNITFRKLKQRINSDINLEYKKFKKVYGETLNGSSFYKFFHEFNKSPLWGLLSDNELPFTKGYKLRLVDPENKSSWGYRKINILEDYDSFGRIKGFVPSAQGRSVFSTTVNVLDQHRVVKIKDPVVVYSDLPKGLYKIKETLGNIQSSLESDSVLYVESLKFADNLLEWFGCGKIVCGDSYSPNKKERVGVNGSKKGSYNIKTDLETLCTFVDKSGDRKTGVVDLSGEGVYWVGGNLSVKGIIPKQETNLTPHTNTMTRILKLVGGEKVILKNLNNKGKISRSGILPLEKVLTQKVKENKTLLIKHLAWKDNPLERVFDKKERIILSGRPLARKFEVNYSKNSSGNGVVKELSELSDFGLTKTKLFLKEKTSKNILMEKLELEVRNVLKKLPLASKFNSYNEKDLDLFKYYLKLEKVIK